MEVSGENCLVWEGLGYTNGEEMVRVRRFEDFIISPDFFSIFHACHAYVETYQISVLHALLHFFYAQSGLKVMILAS